LIAVVVLRVLRPRAMTSFVKLGAELAKRHCRLHGHDSQAASPAIDADSEVLLFQPGERAFRVADTLAE
jgi:hypothetical protein